MIEKIETGASRRFYALSLLIATGVLFGLVFSLTRLSITGGVPFLAFAFWQIFGAAFCVMAYCAAKLRLPRWSPRHGLSYLAMAATGGLIPPVIYAFVAPKLPVGNREPDHFALSDHDPANRAGVAHGTFSTCGASRVLDWASPACC